MNRIIPVLALVIPLLLAGCLQTSGVGEIVAPQQLVVGKTTGESGAALAPYRAQTQAQVVDTRVELTSTVGKTGSDGQIVSMDQTVPESEWSIRVATSADREVYRPNRSQEEPRIQLSGNTSWAGTLQEGETRTFTAVAEPQQPGLFELQIHGTIPVVNDTSGFCCGIVDTLFILHNGTHTFVNHGRGGWCEDGYLLDRETLQCVEGDPTTTVVHNTSR